MEHKKNTKLSGCYAETFKSTYHKGRVQTTKKMKTQNWLCTTMKRPGHLFNSLQNNFQTDKTWPQKTSKRTTNTTKFSNKKFTFPWICYTSNRHAAWNYFTKKHLPCLKIFTKGSCEFPLLEFIILLSTYINSLSSSTLPQNWGWEWIYRNVLVTKVSIVKKMPFISGNEKYIQEDIDPSHKLWVLQTHYNLGKKINKSLQIID